MRHFLLVFGDGLVVAAQTCISETEVIVAKRYVGLKSQRGLKLLNRLQGAVSILIATAQQHMSHRGFRVELYSFLQFIGSCRILILGEHYQGCIEVNVEPRTVQALGTAQLL